MKENDFENIVRDMEKIIADEENIKLNAAIELQNLLQNLQDIWEQTQNDVIDIRDYCSNYNQALCITDHMGCIVYMNDSYMKNTGLTKDAYHKPEPFEYPISAEVIRTKRKVSFANDGRRLNLEQGRYVSAVPIFSKEGDLKWVVITLAFEDVVNKRYRELADIVNKKYAVQIMESSQNQKLKSFLGKNDVIKDIRKLIQRVAETDATILITGESGVGKEVVADCIYEMSSRNNKPYVKINCSAIPAELIEAELFGYEKGAFTGANAKKMGLLEKANGGTVLLDEIGDFPIELQPKLLRVLQQGELYRVGSVDATKLDIRFIAATNANLKQKMQEGAFREDLFYRLNVFPIRIPPVRERKEDVPGLMNHFFYTYCQKYKRTIMLTPEVREMLEAYDWPGNVREIQNVMEYYVICSVAGEEMKASDLRKILQPDALHECENIPGNMENSKLDEMSDESECAMLEESVAKVLESTEPMLATIIPNENDERLEINEDHFEDQLYDDESECAFGETLFEKRDNYEKKLIIEALNSSNSARQAAKKLGIYPSSLYRKAQKYGISVE